MYSQIFEEFAKIAKTQPSKPAIFFKPEAYYQSLSYSQVYNQTVKLGNLLYKRGLKENDKVAIVLGNQPEWPIAFMAIQYNGAVAVPIDIKLDPEIITQLIEFARARMVICSKELYSGLFEYVKDIRDLEAFLVDSPEFLDELELSSQERREDKVDLSTHKIAAMFYTSGTTRLPKAVLLSQNNLLSNAESIKKLNITDSQDTFISLLPLHHTFSFMATCLVPLLTAAKISYPTSLTSEDLLSCMRNTKVTILTGVPELFLLFHRGIKEKLKKMPLLVRGFLGILIGVSGVIRKSLRVNFNKHVLSKLHKTFGGNLRYMVTGGARLEPKVGRDLFKWGFTVLEGYGLTETSPVVTINPPGRPKIGSVGKPLSDVQVRIVNPDIQGLGEVAIKGPNVMLGYYQLPEETQKVIREEWFYSGDLGFLDREGYLYLKGRKDELIVLSSGKKVNPEEVEKYYSQSPYIKEICIFASKVKGFMHESKQLTAVVIPDEEHFRRTGLVNIEERLKWELDNLSHRLSSYMRIKSFVISKEGLPRTRLGKIMRHKVEAKYLEEVVAPAKKEEVSKPEDFKILSSEVFQKLIRYLSERLKRRVNLGDHLELDLGLDSLSRVELLLELQRFLNIRVPESLEMELFYASTIRDLILKIDPYLPQEIKGFKEEEFRWSGVLAQKPPSATLKLIRLKPLFIDRVAGFMFFVFLQILFRTIFLLGVKGKGNLPKKGPCIIYANHASYLDGFAIAASLPFKLALYTYFLGFREYFINPAVKNAVRLARLVPLDISLDLIGAMQTCSYLLGHSKLICFFPEGQRSAFGEVIKFKKGIGVLVKELDVPLVPVYIEGAFRAWSRHAWFPRPAKIKVTFGKEVMPSDLLPKITAVEGDVYEIIAECLREELIKLK